MFEKQRIFSTYCDTWIDLPDADKSIKRFKQHFERAYARYTRHITAATTGYQEAANITTELANTHLPTNQANAATTTPRQPTAPRQSTASSPTWNTIQLTNGDTIYYCWTNGLGNNTEHTSANCNNKATGHKDNANANYMQGGSDRIMRGERRTARNPPT